MDFDKTSFVPNVPLLRDKIYDAPSVFRTESLLREAQRQKNVPEGSVSNICVLDSDGNLVRDKGASHHYLAPTYFADADQVSVRLTQAGLDGISLRVITGTTWITGAPYREKETANEGARAQDVLAVEVEAAALYAFASARSVLCFAHITNEVAQIDQDFEKGQAGGPCDAIRLLVAAADAGSRSDAAVQDGERLV